MTSSKIHEGQRGEEIAVKYLQNKGYKVIGRNFRLRNGEIDIIALEDKNKVLVFVEVKTRISSQFGSPLEAITPWKLRSIIRTAQYYKHIHPNLPESLRIDAVSVKLFIDYSIDSVEHVENISGF